METAEIGFSDQFFVTKFDVIWDNSYEELDYQKETFNDPQTIARWQEQGQKYAEGDMYDSRRPQPDWVKLLCEQLGWENCLSSFYRMAPGRILPYHRDTYKRYRELFNITNPFSIWRAVVFLEDWKKGHYLEVDGHPILRWKAGDAILWQFNTDHLAANLGCDCRYTLQLTGIMNDNRFTQRMGPVDFSSSWDSGEFALPK